jgi:hypothetical protein
MPKTLSATPTRAPGQRSRHQHSGQASQYTAFATSGRLPRERHLALTR